MKKEIELIRYVRSNILKLTEDLTVEQFNRVPDKFNNNIAWNMAHVVATQQMMSYKLGGLNTNIDEEWFNSFLPGTLPHRNLAKGEIDMVKDSLKLSVYQLEIDYNNHIFDDYSPWTIPTGMEVNNIEDSMKITSVHEGRHFGVIISLLKLVA